MSIDLAIKSIQQCKENRLAELNLNNMDLKYLPEEILELTHVKKLYLHNNKFSFFPLEICELTNLELIYLNDNQITDLPKEIKKLERLTHLYIRNNDLSKLPEEIKYLKCLKFLNVHKNKLTIIPDEIGGLSNLVELFLDNNNIIKLPTSIDKLDKLVKLYIRNNELIKLPEELSNLKSLSILCLNHNKISSLPDSLKKLSSLKEFTVSFNKLKEFPNWICDLKKLQKLSINNNEILKIPSEISKLKNLKYLNMSYNRISYLPPKISELINLEELILNNNHLIELPNEVIKLNNLITIQVFNNQLTTPPIEVASKGIGPIRRYFKQLEEEGTEEINEAKLLIVGEGGAGKTTLCEKIKDSDYELKSEEKTTQGIDIHRWSFKKDEKTEFKVNIWDFGGQSIYHATHQFFLTKRSLYILLTDTRKEDTDFYYWLNIIELLSHNSPTLIIKNEKQDRHRDIPANQLRKRFSNLKEILETNLKTNRGLEAVKNEIQHNFFKLPHINDKLPKTWVKVRNTIESINKDYISLEEFIEICKNNGFKDTDRALQLSDYLHDLGIILHFQDNSVLSKTVILKPEWGTEAVYKVLDNTDVIRNNGKFTIDDLEKIWDDDRYRLSHHQLLELMIKFNLCYKIPNEQKSFIAPQLLTENEPYYEWNQCENLQLRYSFTFLPKGVISQLIVILHKYIADQSLVWKNGFIIERNDAKAEILEEYEKRFISIKVVDSNCKEFQTIIVYELEKILDTYEGLEYDKEIPCICSECLSDIDPFFYKYETLESFKNKGQNKIQCQKSGKLVNVYQMIDDIFFSNVKLFINQFTDEIENDVFYLEEYEKNRAIKIGKDIEEQLIKKNPNKEKVENLVESFHDFFNVIKLKAVDGIIQGSSYALFIELLKKM